MARRTAATLTREEVATRILALPREQQMEAALAALRIFGPAPIEGAVEFRAFASRVESRLRWYQHVETLGAVLGRVLEGKLRRVIVMEPPRHGKSLMASRLFPAAYLRRHPELFIGVVSYGAELAVDLSRAARRYYLASGGAVRDDMGSARHWETPAGGGLWAAGAGGPITGRGAHLVVIDDLLKNAEEASSETVLSGLRDWYESTLYTRLEPGGALVVIGTRWGESDFIGYLLDRERESERPERWHVVCFSALYEPEPYDLPATCTVEPDWREPGAPLCPERYDVDALARIRASVTSYHWNALYQGRPTPRSGTMFKRSWFEIVSGAPAGGRRLRYWDIGSGDEGAGDWTVGVLLNAGADERWYVEDVVRGRWSPAARNGVIRQTAELDRQAHGDVLIRIEQGIGIAKESTDAIVRSLSGFMVRSSPVHRDKVGRAEPFAAQAEAGNVRLVRGAWNLPYLAVVCAFPKGANDDDVDATSGAFNCLARPAGTVRRLGGLERRLRG